MNENLIKVIPDLRNIHSNVRETSHLFQNEYSLQYILNPIENLWRELKFSVHSRKPSNLIELEQFEK